MEKKKMRLKGQLRMYMHWPLIMAVLLVVMNIWMYAISRKAGAVMSIFIIIYLAIAGALYFYNRSLILADLIQFSVQYKGIENTLLKELSIPYAIVLEDGRILWQNDSFSALMEGQKQEKYISRMFQDLHPGVFPKDDMEHVELEVSYRDRSYQAVLIRAAVPRFHRWNSRKGTRSRVPPIPPRRCSPLTTGTRIRRFRPYIRSGRCPRRMSPSMPPGRPKQTCASSMI